jgi:heptosyltransferase III
VTSLCIKRSLRFLFWDTSQKVRRLIIRPGGIGDFVVSLPALECLNADYLEVWAAGPNVSLARFAHSARSIASTGLDLVGVAEPPQNLVEELRSFDSIVSWYGANRPEFRDAVHALGLPFVFFPALPAQSCAMHATDFYLDQVRAIAECPSSGVPRIPCEAPSHGCAVMHPFSGSAKKNWPLAKFQRLARRLEREIPVRWCAGPEDPPLERLLAGSSPGAQVVRINDLYELARWLSGAALYVGNDCGITHLAAAAGARVVALFGPTDPRVWGPRGDNVRIKRWRA